MYSNQYPENFNKRMEIIEPTYSQYIVKPPEKNITYGRIPQHLLVDSSDRNCQNYPNSNDYVYDLENGYKDVVSIELTQACIPYTGYIINENNNKFCFQESFDKLLFANIEPGDYLNANDIASALENSLNSVGQSVYSVFANNFTRKFTITSSLTGGEGIFRAVFCDCRCGNTSSCELCRKKNCGEYKKGTIAEKIGFDKVNLLFATGTVLQINSINNTTIEIISCNSTFTSDFINGDSISFENNIGILYDIDSVVSDIKIIISGTQENITDAISLLINSKIFATRYTSNFTWDIEDEKYIILEIFDGINHEMDRLDSINKNISGSFAIIPMNVPHGSNKLLELGNQSRRGNEKFYNPPLGSLNKLRIKFLTKNGHLYDFNGRNHYLEFQIITLNSPSYYATLITN